MAERANDRGVRAIAIFKIAKGLLLLILASGALAVLESRGVVDAVTEWINAFRFDPQNKYVQSLLTQAMQLDDRKIKLLSGGTFVYAGIFFTEGVGLWLQKRWASYLTVIVTASFIPLEIYELIEKFSAPKLIAIAVNLVVLVYLFVRVRQNATEPH